MIKYTAVLEEEGWIAKKIGGVFDGKNTPNTYSMSWPNGLKPPAKTDEGVVRHTHPVVRHTHPGSAPHAPKSEIESEKTSNNIKRPTVEMVSAYMVDRGLSQADASDQAERFVDHYTSNGWKVSGRAPMKCWKSAVRNWLRNAKEWRKPATPNQPEPAGFIATHTDASWREGL